MKKDVKVFTIAELRDILTKEYNFKRTVQGINKRLKKANKFRYVLAGGKIAVVNKSDVEKIYKFLANK